MSVEGEIDLDALIQKDRKQARFKKTKQIQKQKEYREEQRKRYQQQRRQRYQQNRDKNRGNNHVQKSQVKHQQKQQQYTANNYYAIQISGLLNDVSVYDISNLLGQRKIISIKTQLRNKDLSAINSKNPTLMDVTVVLADKNDADSFVKKYSEKKLDGKYELTFTFINPSNEIS